MNQLNSPKLIDPSELTGLTELTELTGPSELTEPTELIGFVEYSCLQLIKKCVCELNEITRVSEFSELCEFRVTLGSVSSVDAASSVCSVSLAIIIFEWV